MQKIAFLFLIYDEINNELLWRNFFRKIKHDKYSIYIQWKHEKQLEYFDRFKLKKPIPTEYADISLVKAQNLLLREALRDEKNNRFIFVSNSWVPLKSFDHIYRSVLSGHHCFFNEARIEHIFERNRGENIANIFGKDNVKKASQWTILTRHIAQILSTSDEVLESIFESGKRELADEYFYLSYLNYLGKENHLHLSHYSATDCSTFEFWDDKTYKFRDNFTSSHPENWDRRLKTYADISENELIYLLRAPCYFGRKFISNCTVDSKGSISESITNHYKL